MATLLTGGLKTSLDVLLFFFFPVFVTFSFLILF